LGVPDRSHTKKRSGAAGGAAVGECLSLINATRLLKEKEGLVLLLKTWLKEGAFTLIISLWDD